MSAPEVVLAGGVEADFLYDSEKNAVLTAGFSLELG